MPVVLLICSLNSGVTMKLLDGISPETRKSMLEIAANAAACGHDMTVFKAVKNAEGDANGYRAECRLCGQSAWIGEDSLMLMYSLLDDSKCPGKDAN